MGGGFEVTIPQPGDAFSIHALGDGSMGVEGREMTVSVDEVGTASIVEGEGAVAAAADACDQFTYTLAGYKWTDANLPSAWSIQRSSIPSGLNADDTVVAIRAGMQNFTNQVNTCNLPDDFRKNGDYLGDTTDGTGLCKGVNNGTPTADGHNTVAWDPIDPTGYLAITCVYSPGGVVAEADMRLDNSNRSWTLTGGSTGCSGKHDVENTTTHEFGHWWGLGHAGSGSDLTMWGAADPCETKKRNLGAGDVYGSRQIG